MVNNPSLHSEYDWEWNSYADCGLKNQTNEVASISIEQLERRKSITKILGIYIAILQN